MSRKTDAPRCHITETLTCTFDAQVQSHPDLTPDCAVVAGVLYFPLSHVRKEPI